MKCSNCQADNPKGGRFCTQCGTALLLECPGCGELNNPDSKFCGQCGASLAPPAPETGAGAAIRASGAPNAAMPPGSGGERRHLTVLFCDMVGSTTLARTLDPEDLNDVTRRYYDCCREAIRRFDGIVANYLGDGVMALFGFPHAHEDDAERAIRAGLSILRTLKTSDLGGTHGVKARVGIATGLVVVGEDGVDVLTREKSIVGATPNFAAHLQAAAEPDTVVISSATRQLIGDVFLLKEVRLSTVKGATEPVIAWSVIGEKPASSRFAAHVVNLTNFVGREQEVALISDRWQQTMQGEGQVVLLAGEAGIGKSRVVETFRRQIADTPHIELHYQCSPYHTDSALYPVITQIEKAAAIALDDDPAARLGKLETLFRRVGGDPETLIPLVAAMLSIPTGERYPAPDPDPQRRRERTLRALLDQLAVLARREPVLAILEDAHWIDATTLDLFGRAIIRLHDLRVFLIVTYRPEIEITWVRHPHVTALSLSRLGRRHCAAIIRSIARDKVLPGDVMEQIIAKTDGVPLFVEELTKDILESGLLREIGNTRSAAGRLPLLAIPETLQDSLLARLDRLSTVKDVAQIGATIGREFTFDLLAEVSGLRSADLEEALTKLEGAELIFSRGAAPHSSYIFKHALVQDAAYETLLKSRRQQLHLRIARVLEERFREIAEGQPEILAHHYTHAERPEIAARWWFKAGELAIRRSANPEAVHHLGRALELVRLCPEGRERDTAELAIRIRLSGPLIATGGYVTPELADNYARAAELCGRLGEDTSIFPVMYGQWVIPYVRGDMAAALRNSEAFLRRAERQDDTGLLMMGERVYGSSLVWRGDVLPGSRHLQRALSLFREPEHDQLAYVFSQHPRTAALSHLCLALQHLGRLDQAMAAGRDAIAQAKRIEHFNSIAYSLCFVSLMIMLRRDVETLRQTAGELMQLAQEHNASYWKLWAEGMLGWIMAQEGEVDAATARMHQSTAALQRQKANLWVPQTLLLEAEILGGVGAYRRAYRLLDEAQALIEPLDQRFYEAELHRVRGVLLIAGGADRQAGIASLERAIGVARRQHARFLELRATVSRAELLRDEGRRSDASNLLAPVYAAFSEGLETADLQAARALLSELA